MEKLFGIFTFFFFLNQKPTKQTEQSANLLSAHQKANKTAGATMVHSSKYDLLIKLLLIGDSGACLRVYVYVWEVEGEGEWLVLVHIAPCRLCPVVFDCFFC